MTIIHIATWVAIIFPPHLPSPPPEFNHAFQYGGFVCLVYTLAGPRPHSWRYDHVKSYASIYYIEWGICGIWARVLTVGFGIRWLRALDIGRGGEITLILVLLMSSTINVYAHWRTENERNVYTWIWFLGVLGSGKPSQPHYVSSWLYINKCLLTEHNINGSCRRWAGFFSSGSQNR